MLGGISIYVDKDLRENVIPKGTLMVEKFFDCMDFFDKFRSEVSDNQTFIEKIKKARQQEEERRKDKPLSWLERNPHLKVKLDSKIEVLDLN